ncbi:mannitol-1-phosphate 5-dehydrogenase [Salinicoccus hispanicus]|uniref:Mannitol-1-phosphate 5-dehydrogenase n=1 Tax=Salinicoccus hispanicus TaxID=157225 RepID=A0A6N8U4K2_9STAP|nr:mannitol-1-phosphate 5-dehydrogenase [Salinicoccus hispanicus]MXQ51201.1 mannitol-1-phosphate 5-dehydrogenase [Salinicoccus hispanicus]
MKAVHFGAGNIGRGFIGKVLHDNGYEVTFADVNAEIIDALNRDHEYTVHISEEDGASYRIKGVDGIHTANDADQLAEAISEADLITTAVGVNILPIIARTLAPHLANRTTDRPLNIIACENAVLATDTLKAAILAEVDGASLSNIGFPNSAVDRIVPIQKNDNILDVKVEPFYEWVIESDSWVGEDKLDGVNYVENLMPYIERKLFTVNTGHAAIAYYGKTLGYTTVSEAMDDEKVVAYLRQVLGETTRYLTENYDFMEEQQKQYIEKIIARFRNPYLSDDLDRVGRGVLRKLSPNDRIIKPLVYLHENNMDHGALSKLVMFALQFDNSDDPEQVEMNGRIESAGTDGFLAEHSKLDSKLIEEIKSSI